jgi:hypothetical protein
MARFPFLREDELFSAKQILADQRDPLSNDNGRSVSSPASTAGLCRLKCLRNTAFANFVKTIGTTQPEWEG